MEESLFIEFAAPVIVGICLCVGFVIKESLSFIPNKYIPLIMAILGLGINVWMHAFYFSPEIILGGMFSGLLSTGCYEMFRNLLETKQDERGK